MRRLVYGLLVVLAVTGCETAVDGPEPEMDHQPDDLATDPSFVCSEAHGEEGTWVTLDGDAFSPLVVDAIASEDEDDVELPVTSLTLREGPAGEEIEETERFELDSPLGEDAGQVRWLDDETLQFRVDDLQLPEGVYDVEVENPNGQVVTENEAFGVLDRPELDVAIPEMTCVAQDDREITLEGDNLLVRGDEDEVPTVDLDGQEVEVVEDSTANCRELHETFTDHEVCEELTVRIDEDQLEAGVYDVTATNFAPAGCPSIPEEDEVTVTVNDPPEVNDIEPSPVCSEKIEYEAMEVDGDEFITVEDDDGETIYPEIEFGERTYEAVDATGCETVDSAPALSAQRCDQLLVDVDDGDLADQVADDATHEDLPTVVTNPEPVGCHSTEDEYLTAMPRPQVEMVEPDPMCTSQYENSFVVTGHGFAEIDGDQPVVHIEDETYEVDDEDLAGCTDVETPDVDTRSCEELTVTVPEGDLEVERNDVTVENPETAQCESTDDSTVQVVPPPTVANISPQPVCAETDERTLEVDGEDFLNIDGELPEVAIGDEDFLSHELNDCEEVPVDDGDRSVETCDELMVDVTPETDLEADVHDVFVTNPEGAQCQSEQQDMTFETVPPPEVDSVDPRAVCTNDGQTVFELTGDHFYEVDGLAPTIAFDNMSWSDVGTEDCGSANDDEIRRCETLTVAVDPANVSADAHEMVVTNPDPVGCDSDEADPFVAAGPPEITDAAPSGACEGDDFGDTVTLTGSFAYDPDGDEPEVTMTDDEGQTHTASIQQLDDCETTDVGDFNLEHCETLEASVPEQVRDAEFTVGVEAPEPVACGMDTFHIPRNPTPTIDTVVPERICEEGGTLAVEGEDLLEDADYFLNGNQAVGVDHHSDEEVTVTFDDSLTTGEKIFEAVNPGGCGTIYDEEIRVTDGPDPVYVDPPATFSGMTTQVTIYAAGLRGGSIEQVELSHPDDGSTTNLDYSVDDERDNVVQATVPEGLLGDDEDSVDFGVRLTDDVNCPNETDELLTVTSELTVAIDAIEPAFGGQGEDTGVEIFADDDPADDMVQFESVPRAYLNPADIDEDDDDEATRAREIQSLQFIDETELNGIVSSGLPVGTYDVIVVNPDGAIGVLDEAYEVTEELPPRISSVSPGAWTNDQTDLEVDVEGENFRAEPDPEVEVFCQAPDDDLDEDEMDNPNNIDVVGVDDELLELEVNTENLEHLDACFMRVTNDDGTFGEYSPITVTNPAGNFVEFNTGEAFEQPRRAPTTFSGVPSQMRNYLYVVGGDDGTTDEPGSDETRSSGEFARLNRFGAPEQWDYLPYDLPSGRTFANGVRVDDFVYLVGGYDAATGEATDEVLRARVLDPRDVPDIINIDLVADEDDLEEDEGAELDPGIYYYRVSATYTDDDPANPGGESLASEPQPLNVPFEGISVTISWEPPEEINHDIDEYKVYRSVEPDDSYGDESLIATVDADETSYTDDGTDEPDDGFNPLQVGSLGTWHQVNEMARARQQAGITISEHPDGDDEHFVYAVGGEDAAGDVRDDYEYFAIDVDGPRAQSVTDGQIGEVEGEPNNLEASRIGLTAAVADDSNSGSIADTGVNPQLFVFGGESGAGDSDDDIYVSTVTEEGELEEWTQLSATETLSGPDRFGHAGSVINDELVVAGGADGEASDDAYHTDIICEEADVDCPPAGLSPDWSSLSDVGMENRVWMGHLAFSGFWYMTGGATAAQDASNTVDFSVAGGAP